MRCADQRDCLATTSWAVWPLPGDPDSVSRPELYFKIFLHSDRGDWPNDCMLRLPASVCTPFRSSIRARAYHISRVEIGQLQPILRDVAGREKFVFPVFPAQRVKEVLPRNR